MTTEEVRKTEMSNSDIFKSGGDLPRRRLGRLGWGVTALGLGGAGLSDGARRSSSDETAIACVRRAIELGINYIDTSPGYGSSETRIGTALEGGYRQRVFLATKTGTGTSPKDYSRDGTFRSVQRSLQALRTDHIDLLQIHDPDSMEPVLAPGGALEALVELKEQKVIGGIGIGVRSHEFLLQAIRHGAFDTILTYADYNVVRQSAKETLLPEAAAHDVGVILGSPLLFGLLADRDAEPYWRPPNPTNPDEAAAARIRNWASSRGIRTSHLALQFCLREPQIATVLSGAAAAEEIEQNVQSATTLLPEAIWKAFENQI